ncbi:MAG: hypothetical protein FJ108_14815 [Deltaproteobacteria bacterium]|nr:hypothetical protein [Deltaproteobacteria bacterium]
MDHLRLVYEDDALILFWDADAGHHIAEWHGFARGDRLRHPAHACVYAARERRSACWLADLADFSVIDLEDQRWIVESFYPLLAELGVRHMGVVMPVKVVAQLSARRVNSAYGERGSIEFVYHATRAAAARWLATRSGAIKSAEFPAARP